MVEKVGIASVFENKEFQKGLLEYMKGLGLAEAKTDEAVAGMNTSTAGAGAGMAGLGVGSVALGGILAGLAVGAVSMLVNSLKNLIAKIAEATMAFLNFGKEAILTSGRVQELDIVSKVIGRTAGFNAKEIEGFTQAIIDQGIQTDVASKAVIAFARFNLDMSKSADIARVAQDSAVLSMTDSSQAMDNIILGIQRLQPRILRTAGINVIAAEAFEKYAEANDLVAGELNNTQKQAAFLNAVLEQGVNIAGAYDAAMLSPAKRLRSLKRIIFELKNEAGKPFQEAFLQAIFIFEDFTKAIREAVTEGGVLFDFLRKVGAFATVVLEGLRTFLTSARTEITGFAPDIIQTFTDLAWNALEWGVNVATQFASGIIQGAAGALTAAMNFITRILTGWLAPGSPPKILPDLDTWGALAFGEFLKGMTEASLAPLKELADLVGGKLGDKSMLDLELELIKATDKLKEAEQGLDDARKSRLSGQKTLSKLVARHNQLLKEGADATQLQTSLAAIEAQEDSINASAEQEIASQEKIDTAKEEVKGIKDQISMLRKLTSAVSKLMSQLAKTGAGAMPDLGGLTLPAVEMPDLETTIDEAFETMKENIRAKLGELFQPLTDKWNDEVKPKLLELKESWNEFTTAVRTFWDENVQPVIDKMTEILPEDFISKFAEFTGGLSMVLFILVSVISVITILGAVLLGVIAPLLLFWGIWELLKIAWEGLVWFWENMMKPAWENLKDLSKQLAEIFKVLLLNAIEKVRMKFISFKAGLQGIINKVKALWEWIKKLAEKLLTIVLPAFLVSNSPTPFEVGLKGISSAMKELSQRDLPALGQSLNLNPVGVSSGSAGGGGSVTNNNQQSNQEINITNPQQTNQSIADDIIFANEVAG